jgi:hypothetical protein
MYNLQNKMIIGIESVPHLYLYAEISPVEDEPANTNMSARVDFNTNLINLSVACRF